MQNQNRARNSSAALHALQEKRPFSVGFKEIKIVTVREEAGGPGYMDNKLDSPQIIPMLWNGVIANSPWFHDQKEHLVCLCLDTKFRLKSFSLVSMGTLNETIAHPREVFRPAVANAAHCVIVVHNHPSGDPAPSTTDVSLTRQLYLVGELLQIKLLDHIIIGDNGSYFSFRDTRLWPENGRDAVKLQKILWGSCGRVRRTRRKPKFETSGPGRKVALRNGKQSGQFLDFCKIKPDRFVFVHLTEMQWLQMKATHCEGSVKQFLATATHAQLLKVRDATPVHFTVKLRSKPKGTSPATFVFVRNLKRSEATGDWSRLTFQRRLIVRALKLGGIIPSTKPQAPKRKRNR